MKSNKIIPLVSVFLFSVALNDSFCQQSIQKELITKFVPHYSSNSGMIKKWNKAEIIEKEFNKAGKEIRYKEIFIDNETFWREWINEYNNKGKVIKIRYNDSKGRSDIDEYVRKQNNEKVVSEITYIANGKEVENWNLIENNGLTKKWNNYQSNELKYTETYQYFSKEKVKSYRVIYYGNPYYQEKIEEYNISGDLVSRNYIDAKGNKKTDVVNEYSNDGLLISKKVYFSSGGFSITSFEYNKNKDVTLEYSKNNKGEVDSTKFEYQYNSRGDWIKKTQFHKNGKWDKEYKQGPVFERVINYF
ncbi:MAG: hypothetical protein H6556_24880 [Lewinellaceae bacterium]|nr:hypothetical protein [Lewinellaceae bacterium]